MNFDLMFVIFDLVIAGAGVYGVMEWYKMKKSGKLTACKMIFPANCNVSNCRDPEGFYVYMLPRLLVFSISCILAGALTAVNGYFKIFGNLANALASFVFFAIIIVYAVMIHTAYKRFFE